MIQSRMQFALCIKACRDMNRMVRAIGAADVEIY